jgi:hypothetical protein
MVRAVHKFGFRLVINEKLNKWRPVARSCSDKDSFFDSMYVFPPELRRERRCAGHMHSLEEKFVVCESARGMGVIHKLFPTKAS